MSASAPSSPSVSRVANAAAAAGLAIDIVETAGSRSAEDAARAVGTIPARIVKSLVFRGRDSAKTYLLLVSGANRVDEALMPGLFGEVLDRPDAEFVRDATGFVIGGVSPFGSTGPVEILMDEMLFDHPTVWAAAGSPRHVFEAVPLQLRAALSARIGRIA